MTTHLVFNTANISDLAQSNWLELYSRLLQLPNPVRAEKSTLRFSFAPKAAPIARLYSTVPNVIVTNKRDIQTHDVEACLSAARYQYVRRLTIGRLRLSLTIWHAYHNVDK